MLLKSYNDYYQGYDDFPGYINLVNKLQDEYPLGEQIIGEQNERNFIKLYNQILKTKNILQAFDDFAGNEIITDYYYQDYQSIYINLYEKYRNQTEIGWRYYWWFRVWTRTSKISWSKYRLYINVGAKYYDDNKQDKKLLLK